MVESHPDIAVAVLGSLYKRAISPKHTPSPYSLIFLFNLIILTFPLFTIYNKFPTSPSLNIIWSFLNDCFFINLTISINLLIGVSLNKEILRNISTLENIDKNFLLFPSKPNLVGITSQLNSNNLTPFLPIIVHFGFLLLFLIKLSPYNSPLDIIILLCSFSTKFPESNTYNFLGVLSPWSLSIIISSSS